MPNAKYTKKTKTGFEYDLEVERKSRTTLDQEETAAYIADIVLQLRNMARAADLKFLVYFLEMSFQEAFSQSTRSDPENPSEKKN